GSLPDVTLERVAKLAGATNQAISQRFSSKSGMLVSYLNWIGDIARADVATICASADSPLRRFRSVMTLPINPRVLANPSPNPADNWMPILLELDRDPELAKINDLGREQFVGVVLGLIEEAQAAGELRAAEPARILELVWAVLLGSITLAEWDDSEDSLTKARRLMDGVLELFTTQTQPSLA
ncbi:MAG: TetR/AcrR family transcriptional regulator, partial [Thermomicrobiales bacterium]